MFDYGLIALIVVMLVLVALAFQAWRGIRAETDRIFSHRVEQDSKMAALVTQIGEARAAASKAAADAMTKAEAALTKAQEVEGTHYKTLLRRIDEAEASALAFEKSLQVCLEKQASLGGRLSALQRHYKEQAEAGSAPAPAPAAEDDGIPRLPFVMPTSGHVPPAAGTVPGHFGRKAV